MKQILLCTVLYFVGFSSSFGQTVDTAKSGKDYAVHNYFIISAGTVINAYFKDKPLEIETIADFNDYVQKNIKMLKESYVVVTGKPKTGTYDGILKTLSHYKFKHVSTNITKD